MKAENLVLNDGCHWEEVKQVGEILPNMRVTVFPEAFIVESIDLSDLTRFVVSSQNCDSVSESHFQEDQQSH